MVEQADVLADVPAPGAGEVRTSFVCPVETDLRFYSPSHLALGTLSCEAQRPIEVAERKLAKERQTRHRAGEGYLPEVAVAINDNGRGTDLAPLERAFLRRFGGGRKDSAHEMKGKNTAKKGVVDIVIEMV